MGAFENERNKQEKHEKENHHDGRTAALGAMTGAALGFGLPGALVGGAVGYFGPKIARAGVDMFNTSQAASVDRAQAAAQNPKKGL